LKESESPSSRYYKERIEHCPNDNNKIEHRSNNSNKEKTRTLSQ